MSRMLLRCVLGVAVLLSAAPASFGAGWVSSGPLSPANRVADEPQVALTPGGERVVAWLQRLPDTFTPENISVRVALPGGDFGPTQSFPGSVDAPQLAVGSDGTVALAWEEFATHTVHVARLTPDATSFVEASPVLVPGGEFPNNLHVAVRGGDAFVSYDSFVQNGATNIWAARLPVGGSALQIVQGTGPGGALDHTSFAPAQPSDVVEDSGLAADGGQVYVAWEQDTDGAGMTNGTTTVKYTRLTAGGTFGAPVPIDTLFSNSTSAHPAAPRIAAGAGHTYVVWSRLFADQVAYQDVSGGGATLAIPVDPSGSALAGVDGSGTLIIAGEEFLPGASSRVVPYTAIAGAGAAPGPVLQLPPFGITRQVDALAVAADGMALVLPDRTTSQFNQTVQVFAAIRPPGGAFAAPESVSGLQDGVVDPVVARASAAVAQGGRALAAWLAGDHSGIVNTRVHVSERDATPPAFSALSVPATATVGERVAISAAASDSLSGDAAVSWDFGDGSQVDGANVSHVFGSPGAAVVRVTATDAAGNSATQTRVVSVAPVQQPTVDRVAPVISRLVLSHVRFRVGRSVTAVVAARPRRPRRPPQRSASPVGSALRLTLSERATLAITIRRAGTRAGSPVGTLVRASVGPGAVTIAFSGRIGKIALGPGSYVASVTAIDGAGNRSGSSALRFTIVSR